MTNMNMKKQLLEANKFKFNFDREIYFNKEKKKIFSVEAIDDNDIKWLEEKLNENNSDWVLYFNGDVSDHIKKQIVGML